MSGDPVRVAAQAVVDAWGSPAALERAVVALSEALKPDASIRFTVAADREQPFEVSLPDLLSANEHDDELCGWARGANSGASQTFGGGATPAFTLKRIA